MKRWLLVLLVLTLCLSGCRKKQTDIPGAEEVPEGIDWKLWELYTPATLVFDTEAVDVLITMDRIHMAIYYDRDEQELLDSITILTPLSDLDYSRERLQIRDENQDGYDDICIPDLLPNGDRTLNWWMWDPGEECYRYEPELAQHQQDISGDVSWMEGKDFISSVMDTPDGPQDLLILVEGQTLLVYLDARQQTLLGTAQIPQPLSEEALEHLQIYTYWECRDQNGDGWGDLQMPYRWETGADGSLYQYCHCWVWDWEEETYIYDPVASAQPMI